MYAEVMAYIDIDRESWKWGDIRKTSPMPTLESTLKRMEDHPGKYGILVVPKAGSPRYEGLHGGINAADVVYAAGIVSPDTVIIAVDNEREDWEAGVAQLVKAGAFVIFAAGLDRSIATPVLSDEALIVHQGRPPVIEIRSGEFSELGLCRLATSMEGRLTRSFANNLGHSAKDFFRTAMNNEQGVSTVTAGHIHGWWNAYDYVDGFGTWTLGKAIIAYAPEEGFEPIDAEIKLMEDIGRIWGHVIEENEDAQLYVRETPSVELLMEMRDLYGIDSMVDARAAGVPLADVLA